MNRCRVSIEEERHDREMECDYDRYDEDYRLQLDENSHCRDAIADHFSIQQEEL